MVLFAIALPFFSERRVRRSIAIAEKAQQVLREMGEESGISKQGVIALIPHLTLFEGMSAIPLLTDRKFDFGTLFRPFDHTRFDAWMQRQRERWGLRLFSPSVEKRGVN